MPITPQSNTIFITTGDAELDRLLAVDVKTPGLPISISNCDDGTVSETTVILIEGGAGAGKTTLALQIASHAANRADNTPPCAVVFLSLEQRVSSLLHAVDNFGFFRDCFQDQSTKAEAGELPKAGQVLLCQLSPLPLTEHQTDEIFKTRFAELQTIVGKLRDADAQRKLFVLDCLNAFTGSVLTRSQTYQLFALFRSGGVPLIATLEHADPPTAEGPTAVTPFPFETAVFLADVVITLTREMRQEHLQSFLEISKSRVCRQGLGKHLFKTRNAKSLEERIACHRTGLVLYPSIHFIVSCVRGRSRHRKASDFEVASELGKLLESKVPRDACFAVVGPAGTHKLALGLNLSLGYVKNREGRKRAKLLIITFGGQGDIDFSGVAWTPTQQYLRELQKPRAVRPPGTKAHLVEYHAQEGTRSADVTVLTFNIGMLTPEECIFSIQKLLEREKRTRGGYHSVLLCDTAELCTGFPLLSRDPLFFATMLDLFETKGLVTVGIGVESADNPPVLREINLALMARATHRLLLRHFPEVQELMNRQIYGDSARQEAGSVTPASSPLPRNEQLVSLVIDNVTGKHYARRPTWVHVDAVSTKTLCFSDFEHPPEPEHNPGA